MNKLTKGLDFFTGLIGFIIEGFSNINPISLILMVIGARVLWSMFF